MSECLVCHIAELQRHLGVEQRIRYAAAARRRGGGDVARGGRREHREREARRNRERRCERAVRGARARLFEQQCRLRRRTPRMCY